MIDWITILIFAGFLLTGGFVGYILGYAFGQRQMINLAQSRLEEAQAERLERCRDILDAEFLEVNDKW
jgi:membrane protein YqaA with SNARE-associated domain